MVGRNQGMLESPRARRDNVNGQESYDEVHGQEAIEAGSGWELRN